MKVHDESEKTYHVHRFIFIRKFENALKNFLQFEFSHLVVWYK